MKSTVVRFVVLAVIGFGLGAAFALYQGKQTVPQEQAVKPPEPEVKQSDLPVGALPLAESVSKPEMMAGTPVGGTFALTDHKGNAVTEKSWPEKNKLVFFGFTHCPDVCPAALQKITAVMEQLGPQGEKIVPLFVTVDPDRDTKEVMAAYVANFSPTIVGLTGTQGQTDGIINSYKVFAAKVPKGEEYIKVDEEVRQHEGAHADTNYMVDHSAYIYLMSPDDKLLTTFGSEEAAASMLEKIRQNLGPQTPNTP